MKQFSLKSMRMTVMAFGNVAFEVYFVSFGGNLLGVIPEYDVSAFGSFETHVVQRLREKMVEAGICNPADDVNFDPSVPREKPQDERTGPRKAAKASRKSDEQALF